MRGSSRIALTAALVAGTLAASHGVAAAFDDTVPWSQRPVTVGTGFVIGNGPAVGRPVVSQSGQWVAFASAASNLVPGDTNGQVDLFLRDRFHDKTTRIVENVETATAMSSNGRYVAFTAPGDPVTTGTGTTRDGIYDTRTNQVMAAPNVSAINNDGWFATTPRRLTADVAVDLEATLPVGNMFKLNGDRTISGPYDIHRPRTTERNGGIHTGDPSLRYGVYHAAVSPTSPYGDGAGFAPVWVDMVTGQEKSLLDLGLDPALKPTADNTPPQMSPNGRYITYSREENAMPNRRLWDTQTGEVFFGVGSWDGIPTNDGRVVTVFGLTVALSDPSNPKVLTTIAPFDQAKATAVPTLHGIATDPNRVLACTPDRYSRFDTNDLRDCYLVQIPPKG